MFTGTIKKKVSDKGFGFIAREGASDVFFHTSSCKTPFENLAENQAVQFETEQSPKGERAIDVTAM